MLLHLHTGFLLAFSGLINCHVQDHHISQRTYVTWLIIIDYKLAD